MNKSKFFRVIFIAGYLSITAPFSFVSADTYIRHKHHTDEFAVMGSKMPAQDKEIVTWICKDKARINQSKDTSVIINFEKNILHTLFHNSKSYIEIDLNAVQDQMKNSLKESGMSEEEVEAMSSMMKGMASKIKFTVTKTKEQKKIGKFNCTKYKLKQTMPMANSDLVLWVTKDVKVNNELYQKLKNSALISFPGFVDAMQELKKLDGFPILTIGTTSVMGSALNHREEMLEIKEMPAPVGIYDIPKGYKRQ